MSLPVSSSPATPLAVSLSSSDESDDEEDEPTTSDDEFVAPDDCEESDNSPSEDDDDQVSLSLHEEIEQLREQVDRVSGQVYQRQIHSAAFSIAFGEPADSRPPSDSFVRGLEVEAEAQLAAVSSSIVSSSDKHLYKHPSHHEKNFDASGEISGRSRLDALFCPHLFEGVCDACHFFQHRVYSHAFLLLKK